MQNGKRAGLLIVAIMIFLHCAGCQGADGDNLASVFIIQSENVENGAFVPIKYTCDGANISPHLTWKNIPDGTQSFALIVDDPDAENVAGFTWVHWNVYAISKDAVEIPEGASGHAMPANCIEGKNDMGQAIYKGPCPPPGRGVHSYYFALYALKTMNLDIDAAVPLTRAEFEKAFSGQIIQKTEFSAKYSR